MSSGNQLNFLSLHFFNMKSMHGDSPLALES